MEPAPGGSTVWVHGGGFGSYHEARAHRFERFEELRRRWDEKHAQLKRLVADMRGYAGRSDAMASRYHAARPGCASSRRPGRHRNRRDRRTSP